MSSGISGLIPTYVAHIYSEGIIRGQSVSQRVFTPSLAGVHFIPIHLDQVRVMLESGM